jgi:hypothetical protein
MSIASGERCGSDMPNAMRSFNAMLRAFRCCGFRGRLVRPWHRVDGDTPHE